MEVAQLASEASIYLSDNASEYIVLPTPSHEEEVIQPSTKCALEQRRLRLQNTWTCLSSRAKLLCFGHSSFTLVQGEAGEVSLLLTKVSHLYASEMPK